MGLPPRKKSRPPASRASMPRGEDGKLLPVLEGPASVETVHSTKVGPKHAYVVEMRGEPSQFMAASIFLHDRKFTDQEFKEIVDDVVDLVLESKIKNVRQALAKSGFDPGRIPDINRQEFRECAVFFETVMVDKYRFTVLKPEYQTVSIPNTVSG